ncbi:MAG: superoxide dismutase [Draconibacterium sp.]
MPFELPKLGYAYDALEPVIDAKTMEIHHSKHHAAYTANFNKVLEGSGLEGKSVEAIFAEISKHSAGIRNNGGGFYNHCMFWDVMTPGGAPTPEGDLAKQITNSFGSYEKFKEAFANAAATRFGSGWAWLVKQGDSLVISSTANQDNPLMDDVDVQGTPLLALDVWENAYYLYYQNRRPDYI